MDKTLLVEKTALYELKSKYDYDDINIEFNQLHEILMSIYHIGYEAIRDNIKPEYRKSFASISEKDWLRYNKDLVALLSQLEGSNYKILLNDVLSF